MKYIIVLCLFAVAKANFFDDIGHALDGAAHAVEHGVVDAANTVGHGVVDAANTVGHGVVDAANVVGHGVVDAANTVGGALSSLGPTLGCYFISKFCIYLFYTIFQECDIFSSTASLPYGPLQ